MRKKNINSFLGILFILTILTACGGGSGSPESPNTISETNTSRNQETDEPSVTQPKDIRLTAPLTGDIQTGSTIVAKAELPVSTGGNVKFILDEGDAEERVEIDMQEPYTAVFENVKRGEHTIDVYLLNDAGMISTEEEKHDKVHHIGTGGKILVAVGDSITKGYPDYKCTESTLKYCADNVSKDGRNSGGGFEPVLNDLLTQEKGYPHSIVNEGVLGETSRGGLSRITDVIKRYPDAEAYLIMYGTNDARSSNNISVEMFKSTMQQIIDKIKSAEKKPFLAKIPRVLGESYNGPSYEEQNMNPEDGERNSRIRQFNQAIDELIVNNNITVPAPDFYNRFRDLFGDSYSRTLQDGYADNLHPDGMGYDRMAEIWKESLSE